MDAERERLETRVVHLEAALDVIRDIHRPSDVDDRLCAEGCGGGWPCTSRVEADSVLADRSTR